MKKISADADAALDGLLFDGMTIASRGFSLCGIPELPIAAIRKARTRCLIPRFDGAILWKDWKEALWDKFATAAPRPRTPSEQQYSDRKLRSRS